MKLFSFDIFDTLISRDVAKPQDIWVLMQVKLGQSDPVQLPIDLVHDFKNIRCQAEALANQSTIENEITLDLIYAEVVKMHPEVEQAKWKSVQSLEEQLELDHCYGIYQNVERVKELVNSQARVVLISDMYLSSRVIHGMLTKVDPLLGSLPLYLSSEIKERKTNGELFRYVCKQEGVEAGDISHYGDNFFSDVVAARNTGLEAAHYTESALTEVERFYCNDANGLTAALVAGASKQCRLSCPTPTQSYQLGATFTGPFFYGFVRDTLKLARTNGTKQLTFLARDGYMLYEMAKRIAKVESISIKLTYLHVSRRSVYLASIRDLTRAKLETLLESSKDRIACSQVAERLGIDVAVLSAALPDLFTSESIETARLNELCDGIFKENELRKRIEAYALEKRTDLLQYFEAQGLLSVSNLGLVDVGWRASIQDCIYRLLGSHKPDLQIIGYYYGCLGFSDLGGHQNQKISYHMVPSSKPCLAPIIEAFMLADHGTTIDYSKQADGEVCPVTAPLDSALSAWGLDDYLAGIYDFTDHMNANLSAYPMLKINYRGVDAHLSEKLELGSPLIATKIGDLTYSCDLHSSGDSRIAPPFNLLQATNYLLASKAKRKTMTQWYRASFLRSPATTRLLLALDPRLYISTFFNNYTSREALKEIYFKFRCLFPFKT